MERNRQLPTERRAGKSGEEAAPGQQELFLLDGEKQDLGITYSGFALTALPHRKLPDDQPWERRGHKIRMLIEPGRLPVRGGGFKLYGVPYGSRARMILLYLQTRAVQTDCREVELGRSMRDWLEWMGLSIGGQTYRDIREQAARIAACNLTFAWEEGDSMGFEKDSIVKSGVHFSQSGAGERLSMPWEDRVCLSEVFFRELKANPVPIWEPALRHIQNNSTSIDIYIWLSYRLHSLSKTSALPWPSVFEQFGAGYNRIRDFRKRFVEALQLALAVYPDARVEANERGLLIHPSPPPVPERMLLKSR